jgi:hypothetical protein
MRPIAHADGYDFPGHVDELVPSETALVEYVVVAVRDPKTLDCGAIGPKLGCKKARPDFLMWRERPTLRCFSERALVHKSNDGRGAKSQPSIPDHHGYADL